MNKFAGNIKVAVVATLLGLALAGCNKTGTDQGGANNSGTAPASQTTR